MNIQEAIDKSPAKVAVLHIQVGNAYQVVTANESVDGYKFQQMTFKAGRLSESGGMWKNEAPIKNKNWQPLK